VALGFVFKSPGTQAGPAGLGLPVPGISVFGTIHPDILKLPVPIGSDLPAAPVRLASLDVGSAAFAAVSHSVTDVPALPGAAGAEGYSIVTKGAAVSFAQRFASLADTPASVGADLAPAMQRLAISLQPENMTEGAVQAMGQLAEAPLATKRKHVRPGQNQTAALALPDANLGSRVSRSVEEDGRIAIYDISAGAVYMPGGRKLEAHSGIGNMQDNPKHVHVRMKGPTPPNVYKLTMRERKFHGVRAIRMTPFDSRRMHGRDGILAHSYLLRAKGNSHGCVVFRDYQQFLDAFLKGEVTHMVVVERLERAPGDKITTAALPEHFRDMLKAPSSRQVAVAPADGPIEGE
jgi:hypothetical protein